MCSSMGSCKDAGRLLPVLARVQHKVHSCLEIIQDIPGQGLAVAGTVCLQWQLALVLNTTLALPASCNAANWIECTVMGHWVPTHDGSAVSTLSTYQSQSGGEGL